MTVLAVDVGGSSAKLAELHRHRVVRSSRLEHRAGAADLARWAAVLGGWLRDPTEHGPARTLGIAVPGVVEGGRMRTAHDKVGYLIDLDLADWSARELGLPCLVDNDARAAGWGEFVAGAGRGARTLLTVTLGTGVGTSVVVDGRPLRGRHGHGGILGGHQRIDPAGPVCSCGGTGCLEALASGWALPRVIASALDGPAGARTELSPSSGFADVLAAARRGDGLAVRVRTDFLDAWARGLANMLHLLSPDRVVLTGGLAAGAPDYLPDLTAALTRLLWDPGLRPDLRVAADVWASATTGIAALADPSDDPPGPAPADDDTGDHRD